MPTSRNVQHDHLAIMGWRDIWARIGRQQREGSPPAAIGDHRPVKQNQSALAFVNFHFVFGDFVPLNSKEM